MGRAAVADVPATTKHLYNVGPTSKTDVLLLLKQFQENFLSKPYKF